MQRRQVEVHDGGGVHPRALDKLETTSKIVPLCGSKKYAAGASERSVFKKIVVD